MWERLRGRERDAASGSRSSAAARSAPRWRRPSPGSAPKVTQVEHGAADPAEGGRGGLRRWSRDALRDEGVDVRTGHEAVRVRRQDADRPRAGGEERHPLRRDHRRGRPQGAADRLRARGARHRDRPDRSRPTTGSRRRFPNIYAVGDVAGPYQFTHFAAHQAWYAAVNALFGQLQALPRRLLGAALGHLHRSRGRPCRP